MLTCKDNVVGTVSISELDREEIHWNGKVFKRDAVTGIHASRDGLIILKRGNITPGCLGSNGRRTVHYTKASGKKSTDAVYRIVARLYVVNPDPLHFDQVNHKDENTKNNNADNLEWCSCRYNSLYGTHHERVLKTKIRRGLTTKVTLVNPDGKSRCFNSIGEAARKIGVGTSNIWGVVKGKLSQVKETRAQSHFL